MAVEERKRMLLMKGTEEAKVAVDKLLADEAQDDDASGASVVNFDLDD
jgi:hypothetical protein